MFQLYDMPDKELWKEEIVDILYDETAKTAFAFFAASQGFPATFSNILHFKTKF